VRHVIPKACVVVASVGFCVACFLAKTPRDTAPREVLFRYVDTSIPAVSEDEVPAVRAGQVFDIFDVRAGALNPETETIIVDYADVRE
jgi:hypothetical protein